MSEAIMERNNPEVNFFSWLDTLQLPHISEIITNMFETMPVPPAFNYIGNLNKNDAMY